jgi:hypothetical protein
MAVAVDGASSNASHGLHVGFALGEFAFFEGNHCNTALGGSWEQIH